MGSSSTPSSTSPYSMIISQSKTLASSLNLYPAINNPLLSFTPKSVSLLPSQRHITICSAAAKTPPYQLELPFNTDSLPSIPNSRPALGEWDGFGADFTSQGKPIELPEIVVPEAFREWEVEVLDWQTQCPTLADPQNFCLSYRSVKLLPTVGCEADAATVHTSDEKNVGVEGSNVLAFAYQNTGNYVALWPSKENVGTFSANDNKVLELEHCLIDPRDKESRVRVIQIIHVEGQTLELVKIRVFCEQWYGPFRNGDQLGGCSIRDSAFASTAALNKSHVSGVWQSRVALATYQPSHNNVLQELIEGGTEKIVRNDDDLITLPRQLWCSFKQSKDGETCGEVGWLLDPGFSISSRCIFSTDGKLKAIAVGHDKADLS